MIIQYSQGDAFVNIKVLSVKAFLDFDTYHESDRNYHSYQINTGTKYITVSGQKCKKQAHWGERNDMNKSSERVSL